RGLFRSIRSPGTGTRIARTCGRLSARTRGASFRSETGCGCCWSEWSRRRESCSSRSWSRRGRGRREMTESAFDRIDEALRAGGPEAGFDFLAKKVTGEKNYPLLFEVRLLKKRHELGLPLIPVDDGASMPAGVRAEYDQAFIAAAREVGGL